MKPIPTGVQGQYVHRVESSHLANRFKDSILPPVFSTPYLILIMENAALNAIKRYLEEDESAVGTRVDVRHLVATPAGREVVGHAEVTGTAFNLCVAVEEAGQGRAVSDSSFHHFCDYNWDPRRGCPSFVTETPGFEVLSSPRALDDVHRYVENIAAWLSGPA